MAADTVVGLALTAAFIMSGIASTAANIKARLISTTVGAVACLRQRWPRPKPSSRPRRPTRSRAYVHGSRHHGPTQVLRAGLQWPSSMPGWQDLHLVELAAQPLARHCEAGPLVFLSLLSAIKDQRVAVLL